MSDVASTDHFGNKEEGKSVGGILQVLLMPLFVDLPVDQLDQLHS
jgi:hypothetical protein